MGIPMIHKDAPSSLSSGSDLQSLLNQRRELEKSLDEYSAVLDHNRIDLHTPLLSVDGYPRSDIDVANVRIARAAIIRLKNDYKALERQIEGAVHDAFKNGKPCRIQREPSTTQEETAFCYINSVDRGSPAEGAGLRKDDKIIQFGTTTSLNHDKLQGLAREVQRAVSQGSSITIKTARRENEGNVFIARHMSPNTNWGGRGAVGAHFLPC